MILQRINLDILYSYQFFAVTGRVLINNDTAVEHPKADLGLVSLVLVAHFV
jgi:hypothetical protein